MRIIPQEELDAAERKSCFEHWLGFRNCHACLNAHIRFYGCSVECSMAHGSDWFWHGTTEPNQETVLFVTLGEGKERHLATGCPLGHTWTHTPRATEYMLAFHNRAATIQQALGEFDEEAERARLMPV